MAHLDLAGLGLSCLDCTWPTHPGSASSGNFRFSSLVAICLLSGCLCPTRTVRRQAQTFGPGIRGWRLGSFASRGSLQAWMTSLTTGTALCSSQLDPPDVYGWRPAAFQTIGLKLILTAPSAQVRGPDGAQFGSRRAWRSAPSRELQHARSWRQSTCPLARLYFS